MIIKCIGSGSSGNSYLLSDGHTYLLLDCGLNIKKIQQALNYKLSDVSGCLISHRHGDHIKALPDLLKRGMDCYISEIEKQVLIKENEKNYNNFRLRGLEPLQLFTIGSFTILPFKVNHDTEMPLGYLIKSFTGSKLLYVTDSYFLDYYFEGVTHLVIECNNSLSIMEENVNKGLLNKELMKRIKKTHFSLERLIPFLKKCDLSKLEEVYLIHLSNLNSDEALFKQEVQKATGKLVKVF